MKIIQLIQRPQFRGAEIFACQLSDGIIKEGHEAILVTVFDGNVRLPFEGRIMSLNGSPSKRMWDWKAWKKLAEIVQTEKPDIIQANAGDTLKYAVFSKLFFLWNAPIVFRNASTISGYLKSPLSRWWNSFLFRSVKHIISVSDFSKRDFITVFPSAKEKISVIPIGVVVRSSEVTQGSSYGSPFFIHVGGFTFEKNHVGLISIFQKLKVVYPSATLGLVGDGPLKSQIEILVAEKGLTDSVIFFGYQREPLKYLKQAHCFLLPSIIEGMPAVILESFFCKVPVVAYDVGGIPEIVISDQTGWLVKCNDEAAFVNSVLDVIGNKNKALQITSFSFGWVNEKFRMSEIAKRFLRAYDRIAVVK